MLLKGGKAVSVSRVDEDEALELSSETDFPG